MAHETLEAVASVILIMQLQSSQDRSQTDYTVIPCATFHQWLVVSQRKGQALQNEESLSTSDLKGALFRDFKGPAPNHSL